MRARGCGSAFSQLCRKGKSRVPVPTLRLFAVYVNKSLERLQKRGSRPSERDEVPAGGEDEDLIETGSPRDG